MTPVVTESQDFAWLETTYMAKLNEDGVWFPLYFPAFTFEAYDISSDQFQLIARSHVKLGDRMPQKIVDAISRAKARGAEIVPVGYPHSVMLRSAKDPAQMAVMTVKPYQKEAFQ